MDENIWSYSTGHDLTGGQTNYLTHADAATAGLAYVQDAKAILAVDSTNDLPLGGYRDSVRITSTKKYNSGLFIADFAAMAYGCSVWPAYWSFGGQWPSSGEIDVIEGVNLNTTNRYTLHTGPDANCVLVPNLPTKSGVVPYTGHVLSTKCDSSYGNDDGCAFLDTTNTSFGHGFNMAGGGVFAHLWTSSRIQMWHFVRDSIPEDIQKGRPDPSSWPPPVAFWSSRGCNFPSNLYDHHLVINTAIGGVWTSIDYPNSGCPANCSEQITMGKNFLDAKWVINYIAVYE